MQAQQAIKRPSRYRWVALSNTTLGILMATINSSIVLISMPAIFRGIHLDPLLPQNSTYLLWMMMGYMVVTAVLVVTLGRLGDMYGRVRMYNVGFVIFTVGSVLLALTWGVGAAGAIQLILFRVVQGIGGAFLMANSAAILTDAFPAEQRGLALGINGVAAIAGSFMGLIIGGLVATTDWRLVFLVSVPIGVAGTLWAFVSLKEAGVVQRATMDWWGNVLFAAGLVLVLLGITYGIQPANGQAMGWTSGPVMAEVLGGLALLGVFLAVERRVPEPMFHLHLFKIRAFFAGNLASLLSSVARGGLMFMLIIWLQGIWLPLHGFSFVSTPLEAAIYMLPLTVGFLVAGPVSGTLSDRLGARPFATAGMLGAMATFLLLTTLPANFSYGAFAALLFANGLSMGLFSSPNTAAIMNSVPPHERGAASGLRATFQNTGMTISIGIFFSLIIAGLATSLPGALGTGLVRAGLPLPAASRIAHLPPVATLFAAFLGYNPMKSLLGPLLAHLPAAARAHLTGRAFFPHLIAGPFIGGMRLAFYFSAAMSLAAAVASWLQGGRYVYEAAAEAPVSPAPAPAARGPLVTISAAYGSGGSVVAPAVAARLSVPFVDRAIGVAVAEEMDVPLQAVLAGTGGGRAPKEEEGEGLAGSEVGRVMAATASLVALSGLDAPTLVKPVDQRVAALRERLESQMRRAASRGEGAVVLGRGGALVLAQEPSALHVRLAGPRAARIRQAMRLKGIADEARAEHERAVADRARRAYVQHFYHADPQDARHYHLVIDSTALPLDRVVDLIVEAARQRLEEARP